MGVLIDSTVLIAHERGRLDLSEKLARHKDEEFFISIISASEMLHGVHRAQDSKIRTRRSALVEAVLERFPILQVDLAIARIHSRVWADLASEGILIGPHDLWIAATAIAHGLSLVTANLREFRRVTGLNVEQW
jgi:tRNA(fMet)-specific endonuclease VapC